MYSTDNDYENNETFENYGFSFENENAPYYAETKKKKSSKRRLKKVAAVVLACAVIGTVAYAVRPGESDTTQINKSTRATSGVSFSQVSAGTKMSASEVYAANVNSTVGITAGVSVNYFGYRTTSAASGSGFIISSDGYVVTNYHVIEGADDIKVTTFDSSSYDAEVVGYDEDNDVAVLKIEAENLTPVTVGDSDSAAVGDDVIAIGNPLGELTFSLTKGVISAVNREVTLSGTTMNLIQTDCAINSGNSGGALFNMYGELIGITNAKYSSSSSSQASVDNIGFAIPVNTVLDIIADIIETGYTSSDSIQQQPSYGFPGETPFGNERYYYG